MSHDKQTWDEREELFIQQVKLSPVLSLVRLTSYERSRTVAAFHGITTLK